MRSPTDSMRLDRYGSIDTGRRYRSAIPVGDTGRRYRSAIPVGDTGRRREDGFLGLA
jgi:hypothetical protein